MYQRSVYQTIRKRINEARKCIQVVMGPRQTGKSTVVRQVLDDLELPYQFFAADNVNASGNGWISNVWATVRGVMDVQNLSSLVLVIDEVQKIPNWSEAVKREWDLDTYNRRDIRVLLLGSSRVLLMKGLSESLSGRFETIRMTHWTYAEMHEAFGYTLQQYLFYGGYPGAAAYIDEPERYVQYVQDSIVEAAVNKDILLDTPISKPALLRQTFELGTAYSGKILSYTKMLGQLQDAGNTTTLAGYLELLDQSGLLRGLQKYSIDTARKRGSIPKLQVYNNALLAVYSSANYEQALTDPRLWGHIVESAVGAFIVSQSFVHRYEVFYWRERQDEVDFVLKKLDRVVAIEVKSNAEKSTVGLAKFNQMYRPHRSFVVGDGGVGLQDFLSMNLSELF